LLRMPHYDATAVTGGPLDLKTDPVGRRVAVGLAKVGIALRHRAWQDTGRRRLTPTQGQILVTLRAAGEATISSLAATLAVSAATVADAVGALVRKGLVTKARLSSDGRARVVALTAAGRRESQRAMGWADFLAEAVDGLSPGEQGALLRALVKLIRTMQERGQIPVSRMCATCRFFRPYAHPDPVHPHHCAFVDAPFGDRHLRVDCPDHAEAPAPQRAETWEKFTASLR